MSALKEQFLLEDFKQWSQSYLTNEELGDRRVNLFIVIAGGTLGWATTQKEEVIPLLLGVVLLGAVLLARLARRNRASSGFIHAMKEIRGYVLDEALLKTIVAKVPSEESRQLSFGGLTTVVLVLNSTLLALGARKLWTDAFSPAVAVVVVAAVSQWLLVRRLEVDPPG